MAGEGLVGVDLFQTAHHPFAHGVELAQLGGGQGGAEGVALGGAGLDGLVHPAGFLGIQGVAQDQAIAGALGLLAGAGVGRLIAPGTQQLGHGVLVSGPGGGILGLIQQADQGRAQGGGFAQVAHPAAPLQVGQSLGCAADADRCESPVKVVLGQDEAAGLAAACIRAGEAAALGQDRIAVVGIGGGAGELDAGDARVGQGFQLIGLADPVLVQIAPDTQVGKLGILGVKHPIVGPRQHPIHQAAGVQLPQGGKAVGRLLAIGQQGFVTKQLLPRVDAAVAVAIQGQNAIIATHPGRPGADAIVVGIKQHAPGKGGDLQAVAVQVQHQRVYVANGLDQGVGGGADDVRNGVEQIVEVLLQGLADDVEPSGKIVKPI